MKKTTMILILLLLCPLFIFSQTDEDKWITYGNYYYNHKDFTKAVYGYDGALKLDPGNVTALTFGGYSYIYLKNQAKGIDYLEQAYKITNDPALRARLDKLEAYYKTQPAAPEVDVSAGTKVKTVQSDSPFKWILIGADVLLAGASIYTYIDANNSGNSYISTYNQIDNTTMDNYNTLVSMKNTAEGKQTTFGVVTTVAAVAVGYTLIDMLFIHAAFPVTAEFNPAKKQAEVAYRIEF